MLDRLGRCLKLFIPTDTTSCRGGSGAGSLGGAQQLTEGGGVAAEIFRALQKPARFSGGGSSRHFFVSRLHKPTRFGRGRGYGPRFRILTTHSLISRDIHESISQFGETHPKAYTNNKINQQKDRISNGLGGARAPQAPP